MMRGVDLPGSVEWIKQLVAADTVSRNSNLPLIEFLADRLAEAGLLTAIRPNALGDKANLVATMPAADGSTAGGLVLSGHTDVVPVEGQSWTGDPFVASVRNGNVYGRGTTDMKGFIGVALGMIPRMQQARLREPIHFALSYDEEVGLYGGAQMIDDFRALGLSPRLCIVGEPSGMQVISAHKSFCLGTIVVRGRDGHSSQAPNLVNAAFYAARMITFIQDLADEFQQEGPFEDGFDVPFTTVSVDYVNGGSFSTTVPAECRIQFDFRTIAEVDPQEVLGRIEQQARRLTATMQQKDPSTGVEVSVDSLAPGLKTAPASELVAMLSKAGAVAEGKKVAFGSEAGFFQAAGIDTVVCGPGHIQQAHIADEFVSLEQIEECERVLDRVIDTLSEPQ